MVSITLDKCSFSYLSPIGRVKARNEISSLDLKLSEGDFLGLVGLNGAGKSTLLRLMAGIYKPTMGSLVVEGSVEPILSSGFGIDEDETGEENADFVFSLRGIKPKERKNLVDEVEQFVDIGDSFRQPVRTYSVGMKTRLMFAIATQVSSDILLMDEVIGGGDFIFRQKVEERLNKLRSNTKIVVLASHNDIIIQDWCNKLLWLDQGKLVIFGETKEVLEHYNSHQKAPQ